MLVEFSQSLKTAYELKYFDFYEGIHFNGDEVLIDVKLDDLVIEKLMSWENDSEKEIRITTSTRGVLFLELRRG